MPWQVRAVASAPPPYKRPPRAASTRSMSSLITGLRANARNRLAGLKVISLPKRPGSRSAKVTRSGFVAVVPHLIGQVKNEFPKQRVTEYRHHHGRHQEWNGRRVGPSTRQQDNDYNECDKAKPKQREHTLIEKRPLGGNALHTSVLAVLVRWIVRGIRSAFAVARGRLRPGIGSRWKANTRTAPDVLSTV